MHSDIGSGGHGKSGCQKVTGFWQRSQGRGWVEESVHVARVDQNALTGSLLQWPVDAFHRLVKVEGELRESVRGPFSLPTIHTKAQGLH